jgi:diguanylate cyclase (GGDEF)-like protein
MRSLTQLWARGIGEDLARYFPFAHHQLLVGVLLAVALSTQTVLSIDAVRPDELIAQQLLANESDANSVVAVQRESFNVALALSDWGHGGAAARDVQIARALLGQRLSVVTRAGVPTADNVGAGYLAALAALDGIIMGIGEVPREHVGHTLEAAGPVLDTFLTETRALTEIFQRLGREQIETLEAANRSGQLVRFGLQVAIVLLVGLLAVSIVVSLGRGYRRVVADLTAQQGQVLTARRDLDLVRDLDAGLAPLLRAVDAGAPTVDVRTALNDLLDGLPTGVRWEVPVARGATVRPVSPSLPAIEETSGADLTMVALRAQAVLAALHRRNDALHELELARRRDQLTGLTNRLGFLEALTGLLQDAPGRAVLVCFLDVDRFGEVNGALGFAGADRVLVELAHRLEVALATSPDAVAARMAADEFAIAIPIDREQEAMLAVDALRAAGTYVSHVGGMEAAISVSAGETIGTGDEHDAPELMRRAAIALLLAKQSSDRRGRMRFDPTEHDRLSDLLLEEIAVRNALRAGEFTMHYQPIVDLATGLTVGVEALARWDRPGVGLVAPGEFLPLIQRSGFAVEFGFETLLEVMATWQRSLRTVVVGVAGPAGYVSVNIDAAQLADTGFASFVRSALARHGMNPHELVLELTEHTAIDSSHAPMLEGLRATGVRIAVDDFGSGYSSLGQSTRLPVDILKLDRSFVMSLVESDRDARLFVDLARMAGTLGMRLIAEGIETPEVAELLRDAGIALGQGFLYSRALPEDAIVEWVRTQLPVVSVSSTR